jgi:ketosteroid isomerase-like protein
MKQNFDRTNPDEADEYFMDCIREGNLKNAMTCFDQEAVYMDKDGNSISGLANIENVVANLCHMKPYIKIYKHKNSPVGNDLIYRLDKWTMTATDPQGKPIRMQGASAHIMRKNADGVWLWLVDNPFAASFFAD